MKINKYKSLLLGLVSLCAFNACTDNFEEINRNPNGPVAVPPALLLPGVIESTADRLFSLGVGGDMGAAWVQQWGKVQYNDEERYDPRVTALNSTWNGFYAGPLADADLMYIGARANDNQVLMGVALVMRSYIFSILTDMYGDIPYTQALQAANGITAPAYDAQEDIYPALIDSLENAAQYLASGEGSLEANRDLIYGGDVMKWRKFANSLRVRLIMRGSGAAAGQGGDKLPAEYLQQIQSIVNSGVHFTSIADNADLVYTMENPNANPVWNTVVFTNRLEWKVNETLVETMIALDDPRLPVYAQPNDAGIYRGVAPGIANPTINGYDFKNVSGIGEFFLQPNTPVTFMDYAQLNFLLAEAAKRGIISGGDAAAETYYLEGIEASFNKFSSFNFTTEDENLVPLTVTDYAAYIAQPAVSYDPATALAQIGTQKWIALYGQGIEAWTEWRRTRLPILTPAIDPIRITEIPSRYTYPSDEQTLNNANYTTASGKLTGGDKLTTRVWWMVN